MTTIHVTADHIARGKPRSSGRCPVALALKDYGYPEASVEEGSFYLMDCTEEYPWTPEMELFIPAFDEGCPDLQPFSFQIEEP